MEWKALEDNKREGTEEEGRGRKANGGEALEEMRKKWKGEVRRGIEKKGKKREGREGKASG